MKKVKIIIPVIAIIAIIVGIAGYVLISGKIAISGKQKAEKGLEKAFNALEETESVLEDNEGYKYLKNFYSNPSETEFSFNVKADVDNLEDLIGDKESAKLVEDILEEIGNCNVTTKLSLDRDNKKIVSTLELDEKDILGNISGEAVITDKEIAFRSKEINEKFLKIKRDEDNKEVEEVFELIEELFEKDFSNLKFSAEEIKHFKNTYGNIFKDSVKDDMITSEEGSITISGNEKKCTVTKVKVDNENVKKILNTYVDTFTKDDKGRKIIIDKLRIIYTDELLRSMFYLDEDDDISEEINKELVDAVEDLKEEIDEIESFGFNFITYGSSTEVYANEYEFVDDEDSVKIKQIFNANGENYILLENGTEYLNVDVVRNKDEVSMSGKILMSGEDLKFEIVISNSVLKLKFDTEDIGTIEFNLDVTTNKNTNKEIDQDMVLKISADIPDLELKGSFTVTMSENVKIVDSIDVPDTSKAIDLIEDEDKLEDYLANSQEAIEKYSGKLEKSNIYKLIESLVSANSISNYKNNDSFLESRKVNEFQDDMNLAITSCLTDYYAAWAQDTSVASKKSEYFTQDKLNGYLDNGTITEYDESTGIGKYEIDSKKVYKFKIDTSTYALLSFEEE